MILRLFALRSIRRKCVIVNGRMNQSTVTKIAEYFATKPVVRAYIFGSFARGENGPEVDLVTEGTLLPRVAASADNDKVLVYERAS